MWNVIAKKDRYFLQRRRRRYLRVRFLNLNKNVYINYITFSEGVEIFYLFYFIFLVDFSIFLLYNNSRNPAFGG